MSASLSGFCPRACYRRIAPATCANDLPLETAGDRCEPLGSDGMWTKRGPSRARRYGGPVLRDQGPIGPVLRSDAIRPSRLPVEPASVRGLYGEDLAQLCDTLVADP